jgi:single-strand DNA-binding protein
MASYNKVVLVGNLTKDPQVRYTPGGTAVADIGLAVNRHWFDKQANQKKEETTFIDVTLWGRQAEVAGEYLSKGRSVLIEGRLQLDQWEDRESGQKRSKLKVVGESMQMLGSGGGGGGGGPRQSSAPQSSGQQSSEQQSSDPQQSSAPQSSGEQQSSSAPDFYSDAPAGGAPNDEVPF